MIDEPQVAQTQVQQTAAIRLTIPREEIQQVMGPAIGEVMGALAAQGIAPAGPVYSYHFKMDPKTFDFEVGVPVSKPITPTGRVKQASLPAAKVLRTVYRGPYEGLGSAWQDFCGWISKHGHKATPSLWECYVSGPEASPDPANWCTELVQPLAE